VPNKDIVVGDVMLIDTGDKIIADGIMVDGHHLVRGAAAAAGWGAEQIGEAPLGSWRGRRTGDWCAAGAA
jgi:hypothetical protein